MTALYAPPTDEADHKKQNMSIQLIAGVTSTTATSIAAYEAAWTAYTPVITASVGTITTKSGAGRHKTIGKTVFVEMALTITTNGTGSGNIIATLPSTASAFAFVLAGRENAATGKMLQGIIGVSASSVSVFNYDNTYPAADGYVLIVSGTYEKA
jgi:hypothetical protein